MKKFIIFWLFFVVLVISLIASLYFYNMDYINRTFRTFQVNFSHDSGFYDEEIALTLSSPREDATIYYTLDGSVPNPDNITGDNEYYYKQKELDDDLEETYYQTFQYDGDPIEITPALNQNDLYKINTNPASHYIPDEMLKGVTIRAVAVDENGNESKLNNKIYIINEENKYDFSLPVISIKTEPGGLFDYYEGIYVTGEKYDLDVDHEGHYRWRDANYHQRGHEWEKPANLQFFENDELKIDQDIGIRIHGGATRRWRHKSLRLYARNKYDEENYFRYDFFDGRATDIYDEPIEEFKRLILRHSGNDWGSTMFRDAMLQSLVEDLKFDTQSYQPSVVFINGEYWGIHNIRERYDRFYLESNYRVDADEIVMLTRTGTLDEGEPGDERHYHDMVDFATENDLRERDNYEHIKTLMDPENHIDYMISNIFFNNTDWPQGNIDFWRKKTDGYIEDAPYGHDGRWRWMLFDTDFGFQLYDNIDERLVSNNNIENAAGKKGEDPHISQKLLRNLLQNETYRNEFIGNFSVYLNTIFAPETVKERIVTMGNAIRNEIPRHGVRWGRFDLRSWENNVQVMHDFAAERPGYQREHIIDYFDLDGKVNITFANTSKADLQINDFPHETSEGVFFQDIPIEITVNGLNFSHFEDGDGAVLSTDSSFVLTPEEDMEIIPVYESFNFWWVLTYILGGIIIVWLLSKHLRDIFRKIDDETDTSFTKKFIYKE